ncbi:MAG: hypothetical protein ISR91_00825 [Candidatus Delongbacteria bacterium]|nr:hypothetical protein [Candidatus Delongbacteria bacterium]
MTAMNLDLATAGHSRVRGTISICLSGIVLFFSACDSNKSDDPDEQPQPVARGFGFSWPGHPDNPEGILEFFTEIEGMTDAAVMSNCSWRDDAAGGSDAGTIPNAAILIATSASTYDYLPVQVFGWRSGTTLLLNVPADSTNSWTNLATRELFREMVVQFAQDYSPPYLLLGNENSSYYEQDPVDYLNWVACYEETYSAVKAVAPSTSVGVVFNFEHIAGNAPQVGFDTPCWDALTVHDFTCLDLLGITTYPFFTYATPQEVPDDYLQMLLDRIGNMTVIITETGWPAETLGTLTPPWITSDQAQVDFINRLPGLFSHRDIPLVNWLHLYYWHGTGSAWEVFGSVSFYDADNAPRPGLIAWNGLELVR